MRDRGRRTNTAVFMVVLVFLTFEVGSRGSYTQDVPHIIKTENIQHIPGYASFGTGVSDEDSPPLFDWLPPASIILPLRSPLSFTMLNAVGGGAARMRRASERAGERQGQRRAMARRTRNRKLGSPPPVSSSTQAHTRYSYS